MDPLDNNHPDKNEAIRGACMALRFDLDDGGPEVDALESAVSELVARLSADHPDAPIRRVIEEIAVYLLETRLDVEIIDIRRAYEDDD